VRVLTASDLHGYFKPLERALAKANYDPKVDQLILLGDYIDRGPNSAKTVDYVMKLCSEGAIALMGNHEAMLIGYLAGQYDYASYCYNGGNTTLESYARWSAEFPEEHLEFLGRLSPYARTDNHIFVHAGVIPDVLINEQKNDDLLWTRYINPAQTMGWWEVSHGFDQTIIVGHTPTNYVGKKKGEVYIGDKLIMIDTGCCARDGWQTLYDVTNNIAYQSNKEKQVRVVDYSCEADGRVFRSSFSGT